MIQPRTIETYPTVFHAVATVGGRLREDVTFCDILKAMFPGGSITGAPKIRSMEIIDETEPTARGPYTGSIGYIGIDGNVCLNIAIRTIIIAGRKAFAQAGGGIVADSEPEAEWAETITKARALLAGIKATQESRQRIADVMQQTHKMKPKLRKTTKAMPEKVFLNDKLIDADKACIPVSDSGFLYGAGLFETMRSHNGVVFGLADHLDRLLFSARSLSISNPYTKECIADAVYEVLRANKLSDARLRVTFTNGPMVESDQSRKPTLLITATKFRSYPPEYYKNGVLVILCPFRQNPDDPTCGHKTTSYYSRMIALNMAHQKRAAEALWFTTDGRLAEGCVSNVFLAKDSVLLTPPIETPVLAGVARKTICQLALANSIELVEKDITVDDLLGADELFLTNVIMQVMPITKVEKHTVGDGKVGPMVKKLQRSFAEYVENECEEHCSND